MSAEFTIVASTPRTTQFATQWKQVLRLIYTGFRKHILTRPHSTRQTPSRFWRTAHGIARKDDMNPVDCCQRDHDETNVAMSAANDGEQ